MEDRKPFINNILGILRKEDFIDIPQEKPKDGDINYFKVEVIEEKGKTLIVTTHWTNKTTKKKFTNHLVTTKRAFYKDKPESIPFLEADLKLALENEDFLEAVKLRDEIKVLRDI